MHNATRAALALTLLILCSCLTSKEAHTDAGVAGTGGGGTGGDSDAGNDTGGDNDAGNEAGDDSDGGGGTDGTGLTVWCPGQAVPCIPGPPGSQCCKPDNTCGFKISSSSPCY